MLHRVLGKKIGMTQVFDDAGNVVPVTIVDVAHWVVTQIKTSAKDGYSAVQLGLVKDKYQGEPFSKDWLESKNDYFEHVKEVLLESDLPESFVVVGQPISIEAHTSLQSGDYVDVTGHSKGLGFQGVVKRWDFGGGPDSHGSKFHRRPGAISHMRTQGEVIKGKRFPGHMGTEQVTVRGLKIVQYDKDNGCLFVTGAIPGRKNSLVALKKQKV